MRVLDAGVLQAQVWRQRKPIVDLRDLAEGRRRVLWGPEAVAHSAVKDTRLFLQRILIRKRKRRRPITVVAPAKQGRQSGERQDGTAKEAPSAGGPNQSPSKGNANTPSGRTEGPNSTNPVEWIPRSETVRLPDAFKRLREAGISLTLTRDGVAMQGEKPVTADALARLVAEDVAAIEAAISKFDQAKSFLERAEHLGYDVQIRQDLVQRGTIVLRPRDRRSAEAGEIESLKLK